MSEDGGLDLSGDWAGTYSYPSALPPVSFTARLIDEGGRLTGVIEETFASDGAASRRVEASLRGQRAGAAVTWLKMYDDRSVNHDVEYAGEVGGEGDEIGGNWSIFGQWSGVFLMVRKSRRAAARLRRAATEA